jgi:hypothetical protein
LVDFFDPARGALRPPFAFAMVCSSFERMWLKDRHRHDPFTVPQLGVKQNYGPASDQTGGAYPDRRLMQSRVRSRWRYAVKKPGEPAHRP